MSVPTSYGLSGDAGAKPLMFLFICDAGGGAWGPKHAGQCFLAALCLQLAAFRGLEQFLLLLRAGIW